MSKRQWSFTSILQMYGMIVQKKSLSLITWYFFRTSKIELHYFFYLFLNKNMNCNARRTISSSWTGHNQSFMKDFLSMGLRINELIIWLQITYPWRIDCANSVSAWRNICRMNNTAQGLILESLYSTKRDWI